MADAMGCPAAEAAWNTSYETMLMVEDMKGQLATLQAAVLALRRDLGLPMVQGVEPITAAPDAEASEKNDRAFAPSI